MRPRHNLGVFCALYETLGKHFITPKSLKRNNGSGNVREKYKKQKFVEDKENIMLFISRDSKKTSKPC